METKIALLMGSDSDWACMQEAAAVLDEFQVPYHKQVLSAHRTPQEMLEFADSAAARGFSVLIAAAGGAAHLPGMLAAATQLPVVGVPIKSSHLNGLDSLLSIAQMPRGVPVATMAIGGAANGALMALRILSLQDPSLAAQLAQYREGMARNSREKSQNLI